MGIGTDHLTGSGNSSLDDMQAITHPGQAHFAGSGPAGGQCRSCRWWHPEKGGRFKRDQEGYLKPRRCRLFAKLQQGTEGAGVPYHAGACRHFDPAERVPPKQSLKKRRRKKGG